MLTGGDLAVIDNIYALYKRFIVFSIWIEQKIMLGRRYVAGSLSTRPYAINDNVMLQHLTGTGSSPCITILGAFMFIHNTSEDQVLSIERI